MKRVALVCLLAALACGESNRGMGNGDAGNSGDGDGDGDGDADVGGVTDFSMPGPDQVETSSGSLALTGCDLAYTLYEPAGGSNAPLVILGHGFSRSAEQMSGLAEHLASYGARVATPEFCHSSPGDTDHVQNGADAAALSAELAKGAPVIHAGHSAGGLAAVLAAADDPAAVAVLGLDLTDSNDLGSGAAPDLSVPLFDIVGEASMCNGDGNGLALLGGASRWGARLPGATHCDFEDPTDGLCTAFCGDQTGVGDVLRGLAAGFVAWKLDLDASGEAWASPSGSRWQTLESDGAIESL